MALKVEIKIDSNTLPIDGQEIRYQNIDGEIREGVYKKQEGNFWTDPKTWDSIFHVDSWEPLHVGNDICQCVADEKLEEELKQNRCTTCKKPIY